MKSWRSYAWYLLELRKLIVSRNIKETLTSYEIERKNCNQEDIIYVLKLLRQNSSLNDESLCFIELRLFTNRINFFLNTNRLSVFKRNKIEYGNILLFC